MIITIFWIGVFLLSLFILIKASDYFTESAEKIGLYLGIPAFLVGVTIVAVGTSLPELVSSIFAVLKNSSEIVVGNVIGSNIVNIFLVLGIAAIVGKKMKVGYELIHVDLPILIGSAFLLAVMLIDGQFTLFEALICMAGIVIYFTYTYFSQKEHKDAEISKEMKKELKNRKKLGWKPIVMLIVSGIFIYFAAKYTIDSVIRLAEIFSIGKEIIAVSAVALGTSLPELMVSVVAAKKGKPEIAVGNVLGSNIFNAFAVMGIPALIGTIFVPASIITFSLPIMLIGIMIVATLLYFFITQDRLITKWEGLILVLFYVFFIAFLFTIA